MQQLPALTGYPEKPCWRLAERFGMKGVSTESKTPQRTVTQPSFGGLELNHAPCDTNQWRTSAVVSTQLGEDIPHLPLDRLFADGRHQTRQLQLPVPSQVHSRSATPEFIRANTLIPSLTSRAPAA